MRNSNRITATLLGAQAGIFKCRGDSRKLGKKILTVLRDKITFEKYIQAGRKYFRIEGAKNKYKTNQHKTDN